MHLDHVTLRTTELDNTKDFFVEVFALTVGSRPAVIANSIPGYWLYHNGSPLIHLILSRPYHHIGLDRQSDAIDHFAFYMDEDYHVFKKKLDNLGLRYSLMSLPEISEERIFLYTPTGNLLETVFRSA